MVGGRPSKFDQIDLEQVRKLAEAGWTDQQMSDFFGVSDRTWHDWKRAHPEFSQSLKGWKQTADERVERSLYERATGYSHPEDKIFNDGGEPLIVPTVKRYEPDTTACIFWLKNRQPDQWRDKTETKMSGEISLIDQILEDIRGEQKGLPSEQIARREQKEAGRKNGME